MAVQNRTYPVPITQRPPASVLDSAIRLLLAGWMRHVQMPDDGSWIIPSETVQQDYTVRRHGSGTHIALSCTCMAGQKQQHCKHLTLWQLVTGAAVYWTPETPPTLETRGPVPTRREPAERDTPPATQEQVDAWQRMNPLHAAGEQPQRRPTYTIQRGDRTVTFGDSGYVATNQTWDEIAKLTRQTKPEWKDAYRDRQVRGIILAQIDQLRAHAHRGGCAICGTELRATSHGICCPQCGLGIQTITTKEDAAA